MSERPPGVPPGATKCPAGDDLDNLRRMHAGRPRRNELLRVAFPFSYGWVGGMLRQVGPRGVLVAKGPGRRGTWLVFARDEPTPAVWVWTLDLARAAR